MSVPAQKPGRSEQDLATPPEFIQAVEKSCGPIGIDLAAHGRNAKADAWFGPGSRFCGDALAADLSWSRFIQERDPEALAWLNPPYDDIAPWAERADKAGCAGIRLAMLVPLSNAAWFRSFVFQRAQVRLLYPRITFLHSTTGKPVCSPKTGKPTPYPKDLMLCVWNPPRLHDGRADLRSFVVWNWQTGEIR